MGKLNSKQTLINKMTRALAAIFVAITCFVTTGQAKSFLMRYEQEQELKTYSCKNEALSKIYDKRV